jgi:hypothetical protein
LLCLKAFCKRGCVKRSKVEVGIRRIVDYTSYCLRNSFKERGSLSIKQC